jgi:integrase/recombinase XerD
MSRDPDGLRIAPRQPCRTVEQWPAADQAAWAQAFVPGDPFSPGGLGAGWALKSRRSIAAGYGKWLAWLDGKGLLDPKAAPVSRATKPMLAAYTKHLQADYSPFTVQGRIQQVGDALRVMSPDHDLRWISRGAWRLRNKAVPITDKRARLQSPIRLVALGMRLMEDAQAEEVTLQTAMTFRDGLIIAFLAYRPVRAKNLAMICCGQHLARRGEDWWVAFAGGEMKNKRPLEFPFPDALSPHLETYLNIYRPVLLTVAGRRAPAAVPQLWASRRATALCQQTIGDHIKRRTRAEFGIALNPHGFRDCAATWIATYDPEHVQIVAAILGHSCMETSERYYNLARGLEAGRRYHREIEVRRDRALPLIEPGRRRRPAKSEGMPSEAGP